MYVPAEEEQNQTVAEQWIEKRVKKTRESGFFGKNSLHWEKWEVEPVKGYWRDIRYCEGKGKVNRHRNGNRYGRVTETETETETEKKQRKINRKQEKWKRKRKATESEGEEEKKPQCK